jgi:hypothetical protein
LRIHKPVAVIPAEHSAPSGAPAEQNTEPASQSSLQLTFFWPLTIRGPVPQSALFVCCSFDQRGAACAFLKIDFAATRQAKIRWLSAAQWACANFVRKSTSPNCLLAAATADPDG